MAGINNNINNNNINNNVVDLIASDDDNMSFDSVETIDRTFSMELTGQPTPQSRPRKYRNVWVNPSKKALKAIKEAAIQARTINKVLFPKDVEVTVQIDFHLSRPKSHFKFGLLRHFGNLTSAGKRWLGQNATGVLQLAR